MVSIGCPLLVKADSPPATTTLDDPQMGRDTGWLYPGIRRSCPASTRSQTGDIDGLLSTHRIPNNRERRFTADYG